MYCLYEEKQRVLFDCDGVQQESQSPVVVFGEKL